MRCRLAAVFTAFFFPVWVMPGLFRFLSLDQEAIRDGPAGAVVGSADRARIIVAARDGSLRTLVKQAVRHLPPAEEVAVATADAGPRTGPAGLRPRRQPRAVHTTTSNPTQLLLTY